jgi:O-antigen/teichoic acid export membrane protein
VDEKAVRGIPWTIVTFGATKVVGVLTTIALARMLLPSDFGLFALATLGTSLFSIFNGNWLGATLIVRDDLDDRARGTVLTLVLLSGVLMAALLAAVAPVAAAAFGEPRLMVILFVYSGILVFSGVNWFYQMVMQRELEFRKRFITQVARMVVFSSIAVTMGALGAGVWSLVVADFLGRLVNGVALICLAPYRVRPAFELSRARDVVRGSRGFLGQELAEFFEENADYLSIGSILGASQLGFYSMAFRQAELPHFAIADPVATVTFPAFAQMRQRGKDISHSFLTGLRLVALLTCPIGVLLSAGAKPFTEAIFGPTWLPMVGPVAVLGLWAIFRPLQVTVGRLLNSLGAAWMYGRISMVGLAPFAAATILAANLGGTSAVAWVLLVYILIVGALLMRVVARHAGVSVRRQWHVLRPLFFASAVSWLATRATADALDPSAPLLTFAATAAVCLGTYATVVRLGDPHVMQLALHQVRRALGRAKPVATPP